MVHQIVNQELPFVLEDSDSKRAVSGKIVRVNNGLDLFFDEYGNWSCVLIEISEGSLKVIVWGDINSADPTHVIELEGARKFTRLDGVTQN
ncbi:MAG: hypothetical protein N5P05_004617 (plasmid) [Chroococcopsis gigantea SAG 12.99]|jgi:hypothetical protein|nr:hypothetical protein [Chroococcopsis gigantea SAG 12.99]